MNIFLACPAPAGSVKGNRVTALRWAKQLRDLGHNIRIGHQFKGRVCDLLIALHARKSHQAVADFRAAYPEGPVIVCLSGTDLYKDTPKHPLVRQSLEWADRIVVLQPRALDDLPERFHAKTRVILQSAEPLLKTVKKREREFEVCVLGHLRDEKDPFLAAESLKHLPRDTAIRVVQAGEALSIAFAEQALTQMAGDSRYRWTGTIGRAQAKRILGRSQAMVISSRMEGGANVVSEAIVLGVPVLASAIPGNIGLLGEMYPGYFPVGDTRALAKLLLELEAKPEFRQTLKKHIQKLQPKFTPEREQAAWKKILSELNR